MDHSIKCHPGLLGMAPSQAASSRPRAALSYLADRALATLAQWRHNYRTRQELAKLDERMLKDAGITSSQATVEASKLFWQS